ncbi:Uncharacterized conserved protein, DUF849 family [Roseovarius pacificus]|uniref:Uncharacterized conserved protein, DUF849 family n=1 Tax=Roseovarius pacificus TaxID=337701 RepID=A0A1M6X244_9RHOB|nr:3-keto-5-aminohexanoate cleavage protein [Roseovarius pacificus]GGO52646.1 3-keto-5-aminohexanoate cleavage protein [Roseovarius pacificus]SHL00092.1 Uncharacterized conserved protein, DUF849 family [Roseovarius pacificus]
MTALPRVMVAPNGARRTKADHPALPMTLPEIVETARACRQAGADGLHLHLRNAEGRHILDAGLYREALAELRSAVPDMALQITTEAVGLYDAAHQREIALTSNASLVSASIREMTTDTPDTTARAFFEDCAARDIAIQHILYDPQEFDLLARILPPELLQTPALQLIFVLGRYSEGQQSDPADLHPFLSQLETRALSPDWAVCAFGSSETACLVEAHEHGGKLRVGFENSLWHSDGSLARDNAERVERVLAACA